MNLKKILSKKISEKILINSHLCREERDTSLGSLGDLYSCGKLSVRYRINGGYTDDVVLMDGKDISNFVDSEILLDAFGIAVSLSPEELSMLDLCVSF